MLLLLLLLLLLQAFDLDIVELQLQAWGATSTDLYVCGLDLADLERDCGTDLADRECSIVVKLPMTLEGAKAARRLVADGVPVTMTGAVWWRVEGGSCGVWRVGASGIGKRVRGGTAWMCDCICPTPAHPDPSCAAMQACLPATRWSPPWRWAPTTSPPTWAA